MMSDLTGAEWEVSIRVRLGSPSTEDVPGALIEEAISAALREYGRYKGPEILWQTQTVKNQAAYPLPGDCQRVLDAWWNTSAALATDPFDVERLLIQDLRFSTGGGSFVESPSLLTRFYSQLEALKQRFDGRWQMVAAPTGGGVVISLEPPTDSDGAWLWVLYRPILTLNHILVTDEESFMDACLWKACEMRSMRLSVVTSLSGAGGGSMQFGGKAFEEKAGAYRQRFLNQMPPALPVVR